MRVKVTKATDDNWYDVGDEYDVLEHSVENTFGAYYPLEDNHKVGVGVDDCIIVGDKSAQPSEATRLAARIEAANQMAANIPEKTLWDEYAMAALTGILSREGLGLSPEKKVAAVVEYADLMMEARKNK